MEEGEGRSQRRREEEERMVSVFWEVRQKEHILLGAPHPSILFLMSLIKANGNIAALPLSAISWRRRRRGRSGSGRGERGGGGGRGGGLPCLMMAGSDMPATEGRRGVIEGEEMPSGRRWGSKCY